MLNDTAGAEQEAGAGISIDWSSIDVDAVESADDSGTNGTQAM